MFFCSSTIELAAIAILLVQPTYWQWKLKNYANSLLVVILYLQMFCHFRLFPITQNSIFLQLVGLLITITGLILMIWARNTMGKSWNEQAVNPKSDQQLIINGPYQFSRNPIYLGMILMFIGYQLVELSWLFIIGFVMFKLLNRSYILKEEKDLEAKFGEVYLEYKKRVPRFLGKLQKKEMDF